MVINDISTIVALLTRHNYPHFDGLE